MERLPCTQELTDCWKKSLRCKVIPLSGNEVYLSKVPYMEYLDLAIVYVRVLEKTGEENFTTRLITTGDRKAWGISLEELDAVARENTIRDEKGRLRTMKEAMSELVGEEHVPYEETFLYVIQTKRKQFSASSLLDLELLKEIGEYFGKDYYVLPSSVQELIVLPVSDDVDVEELRNLVIRVNQVQVSMKDQLGNTVYRYDVIAEKLELYH
ncbi:MAG: DUF5688 family protein [Eubacteriales bacterium]